VSSDNIDRKMEFIVEQQAKFASDIAELDERLVRIAANVERHDEQIRNLSEQIRNLVDAVLSLTNIVEQQSDQIAAHDKQIEALIEQGRETDARLNNLIIVVERWISKSAN
jgi:chromosome segregation ATPase